MSEPTVILDSGAYTAWRKGEPITLKEYAKFLKKYGEHFPARFTLDVIQNVGESYENWRRLQKNGYETIPAYHLQSEDETGDEKEFLHKYLKLTDHIAIGAIANLSTKQRLTGLKNIWENHLTDDQGRPIAKVHGLGLTAPDIMMRFPWYSVDSNSPTLAAAFGKIYLPPIQDNEFDYLNMNMWSVSDQAKHKVGTMGSYLSAPKLWKERWEALFEDLGFKLGQIEYKKRRETRKDKKKNNKTKQSTLGLDLPITESDKNGVTLANSWEERLRWNLRIWEEMADRMPKHEDSTGKKFQTLIYSVCSSTGHLRVFEQLESHPKMLVSYAYLRRGATFLGQVINYQKTSGQ